MLLLGILLSASVIGGPGQAPRAPAPPVAPIFRFAANDFWLNLHHFLYVLGRAEAKMPDRTRRAVAEAPADEAAAMARLTTEEQQAWRAAVAFYAKGPSTMDVIFDRPMVVAGQALAATGDQPALQSATLDNALKSALERAAPIYRKAWWPAHRQANVRWVEATTSLVDRHGAGILSFITRAYQLPWPADGYPVHVAAYANWAGAFSTDGGLLIVSSLDTGNSGDTALETVFHEAMHQWDDPMQSALDAIARAQSKKVPADLTHAMIWVTAGEAVRRAIPAHVPYADANGIWGRSTGALKPAVDAAWRPYLEGKGTREAALAELIRLAGR